MKTLTGLITPLLIIAFTLLAPITTTAADGNPAKPAYEACLNDLPVCLEQNRYRFLRQTVSEQQGKTG